MGMIQPDFEKAKTKGEYAEKIVREHLERCGWIVYFPFTKNKAHPVDMLSMKVDGDVMAADVKAKARMTKYRQTGINRSHYNRYIEFARMCAVPFKLVFVDEYERRVYGQDLSRLADWDYEYKRNGRSIVYWNLDRLIDWFPLTNEQATILKSFNQRNYEPPQGTF